jgi:hypothetical protein
VKSLVSGRAREVFPLHRRLRCRSVADQAFDHTQRDGCSGLSGLRRPPGAAPGMSHRNKTSSTSSWSRGVSSPASRHHRLGRSDGGGWCRPLHFAKEGLPRGRVPLVNGSRPSGIDADPPNSGLNARRPTRLSRAPPGSAALRTTPTAGAEPAQHGGRTAPDPALFRCRDNAGCADLVIVPT